MKKIAVASGIALIWAAIALFAVATNQANPKYLLDRDKLSIVVRDLKNLDLERRRIFLYATHQAAFDRQIEAEYGSVPKPVKKMLGEYARSDDPIRKTYFALPAAMAVALVWLGVFRLFYPMSFKKFRFFVWLGLIGGLLSTFVAGETNTIITEVSPPDIGEDSLKYPIGSVLYYLGLGINEEIWKAGATFLLIVKSNAWKKPSDAFLMSLLVALGFSFVENIQYFETFGVQIAFSRAVISTLGHLLYAAIWGYGLASVPQSFRPKLKFRFLGLYIAIAGTLHGTANFCFTTGHDLFLWLALALESVGVAYLVYQVRQSDHLAPATT